MRAAIVRAYGPPSAVAIEEMPDPNPRSGQVLVRVHASSLNPLDTKLRSGNLRPFLRLSFPAVLGFDLAGRVVGVGAGVSRWKIGDRVYGRIDSPSGGTHAELAVVGAGVIQKIPDRLSFEEAAALPLTGMTALQALQKVGLRAGQRLLVNGAAGGVGSLAVQVGRASGAEVVGVCREEDRTLVTRLGASRILDYTKGEVEQSDEDFDVILDTVFNRPIDDFKRLLRRDGTFITTGFSVGLAVRAVLGRLLPGPAVEYVVSRADGALMQEISRLVESGELEPVIEAVFPFDRISDAYRHLEEEHTQGKVVIVLENADHSSNLG